MHTNTFLCSQYDCRKIFNVYFYFSVYFQLLDKNVTDDKSTAYEIIEARNNSILGQGNKTYEIAQSSPENDAFNLTEETSRFNEYEPESNRKSSENVFNDASNDILNVTLPNSDEYETEITRKSFEDIFKKYDDMYKNIPNIPDIPNFPDFKDDPNIIRVTIEIPVDDDYGYPYNDYNTQSTTRVWLRLVSLFFAIIACIYAAYRKCCKNMVDEEKRRNVDSSEDVSRAFIVIIPKSRKVPNSEDS